MHSYVLTIGTLIMRHQRFCTYFSKKFAAFRKYMDMIHAPAASFEIIYNNRCRRAEITTFDTI